jgi:XTP/dITP diphosphohydrolase
MKKLLIATNNHGKLSEITDLLKHLPVELVTPRDLGIDLDVDETGGTYAENARLKAAAFMNSGGLPHWPMTRGLEVTLDGARAALQALCPEPDATDADRRMFAGKEPDKISASLVSPLYVLGGAGAAGWQHAHGAGILRGRDHPGGARRAGLWI